MIVFARGNYVYMSTRETLTRVWGAADRADPEPGDDWQTPLVEGLTPFYESVTFED